MIGADTAKRAAPDCLSKGSYWYDVWCAITPTAGSQEGDFMTSSMAKTCRAMLMLPVLWLGPGCDRSPLPSTTEAAGPAGQGGGVGIGGAGGGSAAGPAGQGGGVGIGGAGGGSCVVAHRETAITCPITIGPNMMTCRADSDCPAAGLSYQNPGHCIPQGTGMHCSYDTCTSDSDCGGAATCLCQGQWRAFSAVSPGNACGPSNCRVDSDCSGTLCSPSVGFGASFYGVVGYYCRTPQDQCHCDGDCSVGGYCAYNPTTAFWSCAFGSPAG
jgi:hypothetical protein